MEREKLKSRLGFILLSAGCAIGIGNVWKFPYMCGQYGGGAFVLIYILFLIILGLSLIHIYPKIFFTEIFSPYKAVYTEFEIHKNLLKKCRLPLYFSAGTSGLLLAKFCRITRGS